MLEKNLQFPCSKKVWIFPHGSCHIEDGVHSVAETEMHSPEAQYVTDLLSEVTGMLYRMLGERHPLWQTLANLACAEKSPDMPYGRTFCGSH